MKIGIRAKAAFTPYRWAARFCDALSWRSGNSKCGWRRGGGIPNPNSTKKGNPNSTKNVIHVILGHSFLHSTWTRTSLTWASIVPLSLWWGPLITSFFIPKVLNSRERGSLWCSWYLWCPPACARLFGCLVRGNPKLGHSAKKRRSTRSAWTSWARWASLSSRSLATLSQWIAAASFWTDRSSRPCSDFTNHSFQDSVFPKDFGIALSVRHVSKCREGLRKSSSWEVEIAKFRRGSNTVITPLKTHRADFKIKERSKKIEERSRKIEEDRGRSRKSRFL